jgi:hypothetical protein
MWMVLWGEQHQSGILEMGDFQLQKNEAIQRWAWIERGIKIVPGKSYQRRRKVRLIELWVSSSSSFALTSFPMVPLEDSSDSKSIIFLCFLNDTNGENASILTIHIRFIRHETPKKSFSLFLMLWLRTSVLCRSTDKQSMISNECKKKLKKVCHWPRKKIGKTHFG